MATAPSAVSKFASGFMLFILSSIALPVRPLPRRWDAPSRHLEEHDLISPHRLRRPRGRETRGRLMVASLSATGAEVGCSMVRESPSVSRTRNAGAPRSAPWAGDGSGARFLEFF